MNRAYPWSREDTYHHAGEHENEYFVFTGVRLRTNTYASVSLEPRRTARFAESNVPTLACDACD